MTGKLVITKEKEKIVTALFEDSELIEVSCEEQEESIISNIYIGKVQNILDNIASAFIDIGIDVMCYYSLKDNKNPIYATSKNGNKLCIGDEIVVQVTKEATKTKGPALSSNINIQGKYCVLTYGKAFIGVSSKIQNDMLRAKYRDIAMEYITHEYGFIIRTNAQYADEYIIREEINQLVNRFKVIKETSQYRNCYQIVEKAPNNFLMNIRNCNLTKLDEILVDDKGLYDDIHNFISQNQKEDIEKLKLYTDKLLPLDKKFSVEAKLEKALKPKVWLNSGAYLVIQPTEAFHVIDVNTGKFTGKKSIEDTFLKINVEAAIEIAKQIRLRNLSGIILVDFIDMESEENKEYLLKVLQKEVSKDPLKTSVIGMSRLNIVEITRKKMRPPIYEQLGAICPYCGQDMK
ncbi:MAG: hypothetical protein K0R15_594 [Clostridiales bacterium]|jgi:ribonuclease G|nr:hypothetical protein [Clostridiales bacterium]